LNATVERVNDPEKLVKLWMHESNRIYMDRLVTEENIAKYKELFLDLLKKSSFSKFTSLHKYLSKATDKKDAN